MLADMGDEKRLDKLRLRLVFLAQQRYRLRSAEAEDLAQSTITAYLEVGERYGPEENHYGILHGIFRNKCREHIDRARREKEGLARFATQPDATREHPWLSPDGEGATPSAMQDILRREEGRLILDALAHLRPETLALFRRLATVGRKALITELGENKNTVDSRLRMGRLELKALLRERGVLS